VSCFRRQHRVRVEGSTIPGRRLDGPNAYHVRVPMHFRYRYQRLHEGAAVVRWAAQEGSTHTRAQT
jgi:hypothetical protein